MNRFLIILIIIFSVLPAFGQDNYDLSDYYARLYEFFEYFSGRNPNTGTTAFPVLFITAGGKYEGMGTAYSAAALDSGFLEANPAASAVQERTELSFLHNNWIADSKVEGISYALRRNNLGIGGGIKIVHLPFTEYDEWAVPVAGSYYSETVGTMNVSYNLFSNYYFFGLALGANLKFAYRHISEIHIPEDLGSQSIFAGMMDLGILTRFNLLKFYPSRTKNFSLAAVVKNLGLVQLDDPLPTHATFGIAYAPIRPLLLAVDFNLPFSLDPSAEPEAWNIAAGINVDFADFISLQGGFSYWGSNPRATLGAAIELRDLTLTLNYSLDMSTRFEAFNRFSIEAKLNLGDEGRRSLRARIEELYVAGLELYAKGNLEEAIRYWEGVLILDPTFTPAQENMTTALRSLELFRMMGEIQTTE